MLRMMTDAVRLEALLVALLTAASAINGLIALSYL